MYDINYIINREVLQLYVFDKRLGVTYMILVQSIVTVEFAVGLQGNTISVIYT